MLSGIKINEKLKNKYYEKGYWLTTTIYDCFKKTVNNFPGRVAVVDEQVKWSYSEIEEKVQRVANSLYQLGIRKGDCITVQIPNWAEFFVLFLATNKLGAVFSPIPITARSQEVNYMLSLCEPKVFFVASSFQNYDILSIVKQFQDKENFLRVIIIDKDEKSLRFSPQDFMTFETFLNISPLLEYELGHNSADDPAVILFTSGSESFPKGVIHSHNTVLFSERTLIQTLSITENDSVIMPSPLSHSTGFLRGMILPLLAGAKSILIDKFSARGVLKLIEMEKCTFTMGASVFLHDILAELNNENNYDISSLRFFLCGGSTIPPHMVFRAKEKGIKVLAVYGSTESSPHAVSRLNDIEEKISSTDGRVIDGVEVKIIDEENNILPAGEVGEEVSRGPNVFLGYIKHPEMTNQYLDDEGWYYSGDLCFINNDGYVKVVGRKKDMIIRGGQNISPREIEDLLYNHPKIEKVAVVGIPDDRTGEKSCAFVIPKKGEKFLFKEMIDFLIEQDISKFKYPEKLKVVKKLPINRSGKIQKSILRNYIMNKHFDGEKCYNQPYDLNPR